MLADRDNKDGGGKGGVSRRRRARLDKRLCVLPLRVADVAAECAPGGLVEVEKQLSQGRRVEHQVRRAYAWLGQVRAFSARATGLASSAARSLEPLDPSHRIRAAQVLVRQGKAVEARTEAKPLELATDDRTKREAQSLLDTAAGMAASKAPATAPATASLPATAPTATAAPADAATPAGP